MKTRNAWLVAAGAAAALSLVAVMSRSPRQAVGGKSVATAGEDVRAVAVPATEAVREGGKSVAESSDSAEEAAEARQDEAEMAAAEDERVAAFDELTDKWLKPSKAGVSMADVETFVKAFRAVPKRRRDECAHRALNLVPDENVMLLAGVLMDRSMDKETVKTVFNDILNRDEEVKLPIMREIFKDKTHPCWADVAWILDVTGEIER